MHSCMEYNTHTHHTTTVFWVWRVGLVATVAMSTFSTYICFKIPFSKRNQGSVEKWPIPGKRKDKPGTFVSPRKQGSAQRIMGTYHYSEIKFEGPSTVLSRDN